MFESVFGVHQTSTQQVLDVLLTFLLPFIGMLAAYLAKKLADYLEANYHGTLIDRFASDVRAITDSLSQKYASEYKAMKEDGKLDDKEKARLKEIFWTEVNLVLARYPKALLDHLKQMAEHYMESRIFSWTKLKEDPTKRGSENVILEPEPQVDEETLANSEAVPSDGSSTENKVSS